MENNYGFVRLACAVPENEPGKINSNIDKMIKLIKEAEEKEVQLIIFPELCVTGYTCGDLFYQDALLDAAEEGIEYIRKITSNSDILIIAGAPVRVGHSLFDCAVAICSGNIAGIIPATPLTRWFSGGNAGGSNAGGGNSGYINYLGAEVPFGRDILFNDGNGMIVGVDIGEAFSWPIPASSFAAAEGALIIANLTASVDWAGGGVMRREAIVHHSVRTMSAYASCSAAHTESTTDAVYSGEAVISENGRKLEFQHEVKGTGQLWIADVDLQRLISERRKAGFSTLSDYGQCGVLCSVAARFRHVNINIKKLHGMEKLYRNISRFPFFPADQTESSVFYKEVLDIQSTALKNRLEHIGTKKLAINVSGGLDSTLALLVCAETVRKMGISPGNIIALSLPCYGTTHRTSDNAEKLCRNIGCDFRIIDIKEACDIHLRDIGYNSKLKDTTYENVQARERTQVLFDIANKENALAVGTGDMSEAALGFSTYGGDHMSMYNVNCGIPKTLLIQMIVWAAGQDNMKNIREILIDIVNTPVSPELLPPDKEGAISQKTEDIIGPYELHDFFLYHIIKYGASPKKVYYLACIAFKGIYDNETIGKWLRLFYRRFFASQFKRSCAPDGPEVLGLSFSPRTGWKMPSDAGDEAFRL